MQVLTVDVKTGSDSPGYGFQVNVIGFISSGSPRSLAQNYGLDCLENDQDVHDKRKIFYVKKIIV
ncbi:MAG: hypothetical protein BA868_08495 [Desulfobacterales bacterium C00003106]|nr:MAG: hypothetical protein BA868_08495 [Desulfobacterales bacterium C00003106]